MEGTEADALAHATEDSGGELRTNEQRSSRISLGVENLDDWPVSVGMGLHFPLGLPMAQLR